jgi:hypothetical protein
MVPADAMIAFPLMVASVVERLSKNFKRKPRRKSAGFKEAI